MLKLIGIFIIIIGFILKMDSIAVVVLSGLATGLAGGMDFEDILSTFGHAFIQTRYVSLTVLTVPVIALLERNGLRETAGHIIMKIHKATCGTILSLFVFMRMVTVALSILISGPVQFVRPVIYPMAKAAAQRNKPLSDKANDQIKAMASAMENYGNFFGQNIFIASPGVLLIVGTLQELGIQIDPYHVAMACIPVGISSLALACIQNIFFDLSLKKRGY